MRLIYLKHSLEISRHNWQSDELAMWNVKGANNPAFPENTTITLNTVKNIRTMGFDKAAEAHLKSKNKGV